MTKKNVKPPAASRKPRSTAPSSSPSPTAAGSSVVAELYQVLQLRREDGTTTQVFLLGWGRGGLVTKAQILPANRVDQLLELPPLDQVLVLKPMSKGHLVSDNVIVNHQQYGCIGAFMKHHHEWAARWVGDELIYQKVEHKDPKVLHHHWQHFVDRMADQWSCNVRHLKPSYVKGGP